MKKILRYINCHRIALIIGLIIGVAIFGIAEVIRATPFGPGVGSDAVSYMMSARNLVSGKGLGLISPDGRFRLLPYTPPFYPLVLAFLDLFTDNDVAVARWLNALFFGSLIAIVGIEFLHHTRSAFFALVLSCLLAFSAALIDVSTWAMSEPICLLTGFSGLLLLLRYFEVRKPILYFFSAILLGLAFLSRFAGVAFCVAGVLIMFIYQGDSFWKRIYKTAVYGVVSSLPMLVWSLIAYSMTGTLGSRSPQTGDSILDRAPGLVLPIKRVFYNWTPFITEAARAIGQPWFRVILIVAGIFLALLVYKAIRHIGSDHENSLKKDTAIPLLITMLLFGVIYMTFIAATYLLTYPIITLSSRMFIPLLVAYLVIFAWICFIMYKGFPGIRLIRYFIIIVSVVAILNYAISATKLVERLRGDGLGYNAWVYRHSSLIQYAQSLPDETPMISNRASMLLYYTGRPTYTIQEVFTPKDPADFLPYGMDPDDEAQRVFRENGGALILFNSIKDDFIGLYGWDVGLSRYELFIQGLTSALQAEDGQVYYFTQPK